MKQIAKSLVIASALAIAGSAVAEFGDINPYIGAGYKQALGSKGGKSPYDAVLPKNGQGATVYLGTKFHENFGLEAGYNWSKTKSKIADKVVGFDGASAAASPVKNGAKTKLRRNSAFLDVVGFLPVMDSVELLGSVGVGFVSPKLTWTDAASVAIKGYDLKSKAVLRVGAGLSYMVTEMVGIRGKFDYQNDSSVKFKNTTDHATLVTAGLKTKKPLKDSLSLNLGAFVKF